MSKEEERRDFLAIFGKLGFKPVILLCLTLGLAPYHPEPHIIGKIRWIAGGAVGMKWLDWGDTVMHGIPWLILILMLVNRLRNSVT